MTEVLYGKSNIGSGGPGIVARKVVLDDVNFTPTAVVVTGLTFNPGAPDTFAVQVTLLQTGAFQINIRRVDNNVAWQQDLWISYIAWADK